MINHAFNLLMKFIKLLTVCLAAVLAVSSVNAAASDRDELGYLEHLNNALQSGGIKALLSSIGACPLIHSQYFAEVTISHAPDLRELEYKRREFGLKLAMSLENSAAELQQPTNSGERVKQLAQLLDLATWLKSAKGYGNYFLFSRCESLAAVPLAYLTVDLNFPAAELTTARARFVSGEEEKAFRIFVLNEEAEKAFVTSVSDDDVEKAWNNGWRKLAAWFKAKGITISNWRRDGVPEELAYFLDDESLPSPLTVVNTWGNKRHYVLVYSLRDARIKEVDQLMLFREKVGYYPTKPSSAVKLYGHTEVAAAFEEVWLPYRRQGLPPIYESAARVFERVSSGQFWDNDTSLKMSAAKGQAGKQGKVK